MVDIVRPEKGCEVPDGELTHEKRDKNDDRTCADSDDSHIVLNLGGRDKML